MINLYAREIRREDKSKFIAAMQSSQALHQPWVEVPLTNEKFDDYFERFQKDNQKSYLLLQDEALIGVFHLSEIIHGKFQNAFMSYFAVAGYEGKGLMSAGLKLILHKAFNELNLHRVEANIQAENYPSIRLVEKNGFRYEGYSPRYLLIDGQWRGHEHWAITREDYLIDSEDSLKNDNIELVPYQPSWSDEAEAEMQRLREALPKSCIQNMQHVGSTAIPGLSAKPIIDIQLLSPSIELMKLCLVPMLQKLGYEYWVNNPDQERMFFVKGMPPFGEKRTHHVHVFDANSTHWKERILFRDYLISHPETRNEYEQLKIKLAQQHACDREQYTRAKTDFIKKIISIAHGA